MDTYIHILIYIYSMFYLLVCWRTLALFLCICLSFHFLNSSGSMTKSGNGGPDGGARFMVSFFLLLIFFLNFLLFYVCGCLACTHVGELYVCSACRGDRGYCVPWNWSDRQLWAAATHQVKSREIVCVCVCVWSTSGFLSAVSGFLCSSFPST